MELKEAKDQILKWVYEFRWTGNSYTEENCIYVKEEKQRIELVLYTENNIYHISARPPNSENRGDKGYLGCISTSRKPRAGEDWHRGNDLADGPFGFETWHKILRDIVAYELVKIHRPLRLKYEPEEKEIADEPIGLSVEPR
jgi:hypothetical protein